MDSTEAPLHGRGIARIMSKTNIDLISGSIGGIAGIIGSHPFDTVKCRIQVQGSGSTPHRYANGYSCFTNILRKEGVRGLYKGMLPPLVMQGTINAIVFSVYGTTSRYLQRRQTTDNASLLKVAETGFLSGMVAGFVQTFVCSPMELVKIRTQHHAIGQLTAYEGSWTTFKNILHMGNIRGCYQGFAVTALRDTTGFGFYFAIYELLMSSHSRRNASKRQELSVAVHFLYGGTTGMMSWLILYPVDTVKSRFQMDGADGARREYRNARDCLVKTWRTGGARLLYRGLVSTLVRAFANSACLFPAYECVKLFLSGTYY